MCFSEGASSPSSLIYGRGHHLECAPRSGSFLIPSFPSFPAPGELLPCFWHCGCWTIFPPCLLCSQTTYRYTAQARSCIHTFRTVLTVHISSVHAQLSECTHPPHLHCYSRHGISILCVHLLYTRYKRSPVGHMYIHCILITNYVHTFSVCIHPLQTYAQALHVGTHSKSAHPLYMRTS